jgi:glucose/arabinose dehydrogenase
MRQRIAVIIGTYLAAQLALVSTPASAGARIRAREVVGGLNQPVAFTFGPGRKIWYVEKGTGQVRIHDLDTGADRLFVMVRGVNGDGERGMLGIALHPSYPAKPLVYVYATRSADGRLSNQILRYRDDQGSGVNRTVLFTSVAGGSSYHNGGRIAFGPDGMLYAIVGDAHDSTNAQDTANEDRGKIIRIEPDGDVPSDNPFGDRVWAFGIRNSFGFAFDPRTDELWETENGPSCNDEINRIRGGENYGWGRTRPATALPPPTRTRTVRARSCPSSSTRTRSASPASRFATAAASARRATARRSSERRTMAR